MSQLSQVTGRNGEFFELQSQKVGQKLKKIPPEPSHFLPRRATPTNMKQPFFLL
jgi:hypothetical protein